MWDSHSLSQNQLQDYRNAAEQAWGDDTRHPDFIGHPNPGAGQCRVTSKWLAGQIGGHLATQGGHYFTLSPDKTHVIDLTGDQNATPPNPSMGQMVDEEDEPYDLDPEQQQWRPGPVMFKKANHPLYRNARLIAPAPDDDRSRVFKERANAALQGRLSKVADLMGDAYPGEEPQAEADTEQRYMHDSLSDLQMTQEPIDKEYKFFYGSGQLHVSPVHSHDELRDHSDTPEDHNGPIAVGYVHVHGGDAVWSVESNVALRGLVGILKEYSKTVGWKWSGLIGGDGQPVHDDFGAKKSMWFAPSSAFLVSHNGEQPRAQNTEELVMAPTPFRGACCIDIVGRVARYRRSGNPKWVHDILQEWAKDSGYRLAEYPGGTNMVDRMKNWETLQMFDKGDPDWEPEKAFDGEPKGPLTCPNCGEECANFRALVLHKKDHEPTERIEDGHFPALEDMDAVLPQRRRNSEPSAQPIASFREASQVEGFDLYASVWGYDNDDGLRFYGGYLNGQMLGYGVVRPKEDGAEIVMIHSAIPHIGIGTAIADKIKLHYPIRYSHAASPEGEKFMKARGMVNVEGQLYKSAAGQEPKDLIQAPVPFIYDIQADHITTGHPGMKTSDIMGQFTAGGIVEGYYEPGGKVVINTQTNMPYSTYHLMQLWYWTHPHMQITNLELEDQKGETTKLAKVAGEDVGSYLRTLTATEPAAWNAYQALRNAGGKVYVVGGAVRDALLQKNPKDIDLMVSGVPPEQVDHVLNALPGRVDLTGKRFGVYRYRTKGQEVEVALPREDSYEGERRGQGQITVDPNLPVEKDLERRDFTANSMAVDLDTGKLIDPYGGAKDIESNVLRTTHPSSFSEDPTRLVRALVASSMHGLVPDERTRAEMEENAHRLDRESPDALKQQLDKLLESPNPAGAMRLAQDTGVLKHLFPELGNNFDYDQRNSHHTFTLGEHSLGVLGNAARLSKDPDLRLAALLHDIGKPASAWEDPATQTNHYYPEMLDGQHMGADHAAVGADMAEKRLRETYNFPVSRMRRVNELIKYHMFDPFLTTKGARKFLNRVGDNADDLLTLREADQTGKGQTDEQVATRTSADSMRNLVEQVRGAGEPTSQSGLSLNGNDLIAMGVPAGPQIGELLRKLTNDVIENPQLNDRSALTQRAQEYVNAIPQ